MHEPHPVLQAEIKKIHPDATFRFLYKEFPYKITVVYKVQYPTSCSIQ